MDNEDEEIELLTQEDGSNSKDNNNEIDILELEQVLDKKKISKEYWVVLLLVVIVIILLIVMMLKK